MPYIDKFIDLHLHLDGAITPDIAKRLAALQNITLPAENDEDLTRLLRVPENCANLNDFLQCFALPGSLMQTPEGLREAAALVCRDLQAQNVVYAELRFAPQKHCERGMTQEDAVRAVLEGVRQSGMHANVILCFMRGEGNDAENLETLELAKRYLVKDGGVVALDIAGAEALFPTANYAALFAKTREYGVPFTIHAGEADGPESVRLAVQYGAARIGHGVRSCEDAFVVALLAQRGTCLEMCPTSNRQTVAVADMTKYPLMDYLAQGIKVTVNTDDPAIEGTTLAKEFSYLEEQFGLSAEQERVIVANAIDAAFTDDETKAELRGVFGIA